MGVTFFFFFFFELMICLNALIAVAIVAQCYRNGKEAIGMVIEVETRRNNYDLILDVEDKETVLFNSKIPYEIGSRLCVKYFDIKFSRARLLVDVEGTRAKYVCGKVP